MKPSDAYAHIALRKTERVEIDKLEGRITVGLVTPYPPGIPLLIPGEVFNKKIVDYLKFSREFNAKCPGFETDIHGLVEEGCRMGWCATLPTVCVKQSKRNSAIGAILIAAQRLFHGG
jgi:arginine/lysine/ornithine decarboxylase